MPPLKNLQSKGRCEHIGLPATFLLSFVPLSECLSIINRWIPHSPTPSFTLFPEISLAPLLSNPSCTVIRILMKTTSRREFQITQPLRSSSQSLYVRIISLLKSKCLQLLFSHSSPRFLTGAWACRVPPGCDFSSAQMWPCLPLCLRRSSPEVGTGSNARISQPQPHNNAPRLWYMSQVLWTQSGLMVPSGTQLSTDRQSNTTFEIQNVKCWIMKPSGPYYVVQQL